MLSIYFEEISETHLTVASAAATVVPLPLAIEGVASGNVVRLGVRHAVGGLRDAALVGQAGEGGRDSRQETVESAGMHFEVGVFCPFEGM